jgi:hypothetical protein
LANADTGSEMVDGIHTMQCGSHDTPIRNVSRNQLHVFVQIRWPDGFPMHLGEHCVEHAHAITVGEEFVGEM